MLRILAALLLAASAPGAPAYAALAASRGAKPAVRIAVNLRSIQGVHPAAGVARAPRSANVRGIPSAARKAAAAAQVQLSRAGALAARAHDGRLPGESSEAAAADWQGLWSGSKTRPADEVSAASAEAAASAPASLAARTGRAGGFAAALVPLAAAQVSAAPLAPSSLPHLLSILWTRFGHWVEAGAVLAATYGLSRAAEWAAGRLADRAGASDHHKNTGQRVASYAAWLVGTPTILRAWGLSWPEVVTALQYGAVFGVTVAVREDIALITAGLRFLFTPRPFEIGDLIQVGKKRYTVKAFKLTEVLLSEETTPNSITKLEYDDLAAQPFFVHRANRSPINPAKTRRQFTWAGFVKLAKTSVEPIQGRPALAALALMGAALGLPLVQSSIPFSLAQTLFPYAHGGLILYAFRAAERWLSGSITRLAEKRKWPDNETDFWKRLVQGTAYLAGGGLALEAMGLPWPSLRQELGWTAGGAFLLANLTTLLNVWRSFRKSWHGDFRIGTFINAERAEAAGRIFYKNWQYLKLEAPEGYTVVYYEVLNNSGHTPVAEQDVPGLQAKIAARKDAVKP